MESEKYFEEMDVLEELEDLEILGDYSSENSILQKKEISNQDIFNYLDNHSLASFIQQKQITNFPIMIITKNLIIKWRNKSFQFHFEHDNNLLNQNFAASFSLYEEGNLYQAITRHIGNEEFIFCWQGRVVKSEMIKKSTISNLLLFPLINSKTSESDLYLGIFEIVTEEIKNSLKKTFNSLLEASKLKDNDTGNHIFRVNAYSRELALYLKGKPGYEMVTADFIEDISYLAAMHDVGKIGTPDDILNKNGKLTKIEKSIMDEHTKNGAFILSSYPNPMAKQIAISHHEKWDGSGYPYGLEGEQIPLAARIVAVADVYDALRSKRAYKEGFSREKSEKIIIDGTGTHFDPDLVSAFIELKDKFDEIFTRLYDEPNRH